MNAIKKAKIILNFDFIDKMLEKQKFTYDVMVENL